MKVLIITAIILLIISMGLVGYQFFSSQAPTPTNDINTVRQEKPRQAVADQYFTSVSLSQEAVDSDEQLILTWQLTAAAAEAQYYMRTIDLEQDIYVHQSQKQSLAGLDGAAMKNPGRTGQFELWLYVVEPDGQDALAAVFPFRVE